MKKKRKLTLFIFFVLSLCVFDGTNAVHKKHKNHKTLKRDQIPLKVLEVNANQVENGFKQQQQVPMNNVMMSDSTFDQSKLNDRRQSSYHPSNNTSVDINTNNRMMIYGDTSVKDKIESKEKNSTKGESSEISSKEKDDKQSVKEKDDKQPVKVTSNESKQISRPTETYYGR